MTPIYYDVDGGEYRLVNPDKLLVALELGKRQLKGLITKPAFDMGRISKGDVFLDIDAVWHLSPDRGVLAYNRRIALALLSLRGKWD